MVEKEAQENPATPTGWAQNNPANPDAHPGGELVAIEQQKRQDTAQWEDAQNRSPIDGANPAQPPGFAVPDPTGGPIPGQGADSNPPTGPVMSAKVFVEKTATTLRGSKVLVAADEDAPVLGELIGVNEDEFAVQWRDGQLSIESKTDYQLVTREEPEAE